VRLLAVVTLKLSTQGRQYRLPTDRDYQAVQQRLAALFIAGKSTSVSTQRTRRQLPRYRNPIPLTIELKRNS